MWCSGITSASHAEGPGFKSQWVHHFCKCTHGRPGPSFPASGQGEGLPVFLTSNRVLVMRAKLYLGEFKALHTLMVLALNC